MNLKFHKFVAKATAAATILATFATVTPAHAAPVTSFSYSQTGTAAASPFTAGGGTIVLGAAFPTGTTLTLFFPDTVISAAGTGTCTTGTTTNTFSNAGGDGTVTMTSDATPCAGTLTFSGIAGTNPPTTGTITISIAGTNNFSGAVLSGIQGNDSVTVTATVAAAFTFNVGAQVPPATTCDTTFAGAGGTVALGLLELDKVSASDVLGVNHICSRLTTNATSGVQVSVTSANAGLASLSVPADEIVSNGGAITAGSEDYGLCTNETVHGATSGATPVADGGFAAPTDCGPDIIPTSIGALSGVSQPIWHVTAPSVNAFQNIVVAAAISTATRAHADYQDVLTFVAVSTF